MVEIDTGEKPPEGTGEKIIEAYSKTKPTCWEFLDECRGLPASKGYYQSPTGYKRHFHVHTNTDGIPQWLVKKINSPQEREACNIPMQSIVAYFLAKACIGMLEEIREKDLPFQIVCPLYDALYVKSPIDRIDECKALMIKWLHEKTFVELPGGILRFNLDEETTIRWATKPDYKEKELLSKKSE